MEDTVCIVYSSCRYARRSFAHPNFPRHFCAPVHQSSANEHLVQDDPLVPQLAPFRRTRITLQGLNVILVRGTERVSL